MAKERLQFCYSALESHFHMQKNMATGVLFCNRNNGNPRTHLDNKHVALKKQKKKEL